MDHILAAPEVSTYYRFHGNEAQLLNLKFMPHVKTVGSFDLRLA